MKSKIFLFIVSASLMSSPTGAQEFNSQEYNPGIEDNMMNYEDAIASEDILAPSEIEREEEILYPPQEEKQVRNLEDGDIPSEEY